MTGYLQTAKALRIWSPIPNRFLGINPSPVSNTDNPIIEGDRFQLDVQRSKYTKQSQRSLFYLQPATTSYLVGVLARTQDQRFVLGASQYLTAGHWGVVYSMLELYGGIESILWGGEICLRNNSEELSFGQINSINHTSGMLHRLKTGGLVRPEFRDVTFDNRAGNLLADKFLQLPFYDREAPDIHQFDKDHQHLYRALNQIGLGNLRHDLYSLLFKFVKIGFRPEGSVENGVRENIGELKQSGHLERYVKQLVSVCKIMTEFQIDGYKDYLKLIQYLEVMLKRDLFDEELIGVDKIVRQLDSYRIETMQDGHGAEYDMYELEKSWIERIKYSFRMRM